MTESQIAKVKEIYIQICRKFNLDKETEKLSWDLLSAFYDKFDNKSQLSKEIWMICSIYVVSTQILPSTSSSGISLSQLLLHLNMKILEFFDPLETFINTLYSDDDKMRRKGLDHASFLKSKFLTNTLLFSKYQKLYENYFNKVVPTTNPQLSPLMGSGKKRRAADTQSVFNFGWMLFLVSRGKLLNTNPPDYIKSLYLLYCVFDLMLFHAPSKVCTSETLKITGRLPSLNFENQEQHTNYDTISLLCDKSKVCKAVKNFQETIFYPFITNLCNRHILKSSDNHNTIAPNSNKLYLGNMMDKNLDINLKALNKEYDFIIRGGCDFDEKMFLLNHDQIKPVTTGSSEKQIVWLNGLLENMNDEPSEKLVERFKSCSKGSPDEMIKNIVSSITSNINFQTDDKERKRQVICLFYHMLESLIELEAKRVNNKTQDFSSLLRNSKFLSSLFILSIEIIVCCYNLIDVSYPYFLKKLNIPAFDVCIVIESIVKSMSTLPISIKTHLVSIEEKTLESYIWEKDSPLIAGISKERKNLYDQLHQSGTPIKPNQNACAVFASPPPKKSYNNTNMGVVLLLRKASYLAYIRIKKIISDISEFAMLDSNTVDSFLKQVEYTFMYIVTQTDLLVDRHMDQIILCSVYMIAKINKVEITFGKILEKYDTQPQSSKSVYTNVRMNDDDSNTNNIIFFYNQIFIPSLESYIQTFKDINHTGSTSHNLLSTHTKSSKALEIVSPLKHVNFERKSHNLLSTPMSKATPLLFDETYSKGQSTTKYFIGKSPSKQLTEINKAVNTQRHDNIAKVLDFDENNS